MTLFFDMVGKDRSLTLYFIQYGDDYNIRCKGRFQLSLLSLKDVVNIGFAVKCKCTVPPLHSLYIYSGDI